VTSGADPDPVSQFSDPDLMQAMAEQTGSPPAPDHFRWEARPATEHARRRVGCVAIAAVLALVLAVVIFVLVRYA
jgi:hypothetical protein